MMTLRPLDWVSFLVLLRFSVCLLAASSVPWYNESDHYWNMNRIFYRVLRDTPPSRGENRWHAHVKGASEVTPSPPNLGIRLHGTNSWINLGFHYNSCFVDVALCSRGLSIAFWVKGYERGTRQDMLVFGESNRGITVVKTKDDILETRVSSMTMNKTWVVSSVGKVIDPWTWHHVGISWNASVGLAVYLNATRLLTNSSTTPLSQAITTPSNWSMYIGKNADVAVDELVLWSHVVSNDTITKAFDFKTGIPASNAGCRPGWIAHLQFCYRTFNTKTSWASAHKSCHKSSSGLLSIVNAQEDDFIRNRMSIGRRCIHLGLTVRQGTFDWSDDSVWGYSRLCEQGNISVYDSEQCVYRNGTDSLWYANDCQRKCGYVCKTYRAGVFRSAGFQCHARHLHRGISGYRLSVVAVGSQVECAMECLIYGTGCRTYNYQRYDKGYSEEFSEHLCELNGSRNRAYLVDMDGYQYCERN